MLRRDQISCRRNDVCWSFATPIVRLTLLSLAYLLASGIAAQADEDDAFGSPEAQRMAIVCFLLVGIWLLFACWRAVRTKTVQGSVWEKQQSLPAWLSRWLDKLHASRLSREDVRSSVAKAKSRRANRK